MKPCLTLLDQSVCLHSERTRSPVSGVPIKRTTGSPERKALICGVYGFLWCKYSRVADPRLPTRGHRAQSRSSSTPPGPGNWFNGVSRLGGRWHEARAGSTPVKGGQKGQPLCVKSRQGSRASGKLWAAAEYVAQ